MAPALARLPGSPRRKVCDAFADAGGDASHAGPLHPVMACRPLATERAVSTIVDNALKFSGRAEVRRPGSGDRALDRARPCGTVEPPDRIPHGPRVRIHLPLTV